MMRRTALATGVVLAVLAFDGGCRSDDGGREPSPSVPTTTTPTTTAATTSSPSSSSADAPDTTTAGPTTVAPPLDPDDPNYPTIAPRPVPSYPDAGR